MGYACLLLGCVIALSLSGAHALSSSEQSLQKVFADLIIRLKKWIHENEAQLKLGMNAIRKHLSLWGVGLGPSGHKSGPWAPDKTSNNIRPKPVPKPRPTFRPWPSNRPKLPTDRMKIPRWNRKNPRLSKSPYDPKYFRQHSRIGRSADVRQERQRDDLITQCLDILSDTYSFVESVSKSTRKSGNRVEELLHEKKRDLDHMTMDELRSLLKQLQSMEANVVLNPKSGEVTIDGKPIDIGNIDKICCPFG